VTDVRPLVPAVARAAEVLELLAGATEPMGVSAIARSLGLPKSSVANLCGALVDAGFLRPHRSGFALGSKLAQLGAAYLSGVDQVGLFHEGCEHLGPGRSETAQLAQLGDGIDVVYLARHEGVHPVRLASTPGRALPATCTATGKAMLATLPTDEVRRRLADGAPLPKLTPHSITSARAVLAELASIRESGVAYDRQEVIEGVVCLAVAVASASPAEPPMAVSFTLLAPRADRGNLDVLAADLSQMARSIASGLGVAEPGPAPSSVVG